MERQDGKQFATSTSPETQAPASSSVVATGQAAANVRGAEPDSSAATDHSTPRHSLRSVLEGRPATMATIAIGPEGGWTDTEFESAQRCGFLEGSLGRLILRTETAVIAALASLNYALDGQ